MTRPTCSVILVGLMGTGKTTVAELVGRNLGLAVLDTDRLVEQATGRTVREIFEVDGEDVFRDIESREFARALGSTVPVVVAAAGGVVLRETNRMALDDARRSGRVRVVWLTAEVDELVARTEGGVHRPLLDNDRRGQIDRMQAERAPLYRRVSDAIVSTSGRAPEEVADQVVHVVVAHESEATA